MRTNFNSVYLNDLKTQLKGANQPTRFFDSFSLQSFLNELTPEKKEKLFSIGSQAIIEDIHASLTQVLSMTRRNKIEKSRFHYFTIPKEGQEYQDSPSEEVEAISVCDLTELNFFYEDPYFQYFVESLALLNQRNYQHSIVEADEISEDDLKKYIVDKDYLSKKRPIIKVTSEKLDRILYTIQNVIQDFGQGFKHVLTKDNEEKLFFNVTTSLMYQLNGTGKFVRHNVSNYISKLYASFLAVAIVFENKLLRKYEKHLYKKTSASHEAISNYLRKTVETIKGIHIGNLVVPVSNCDEEEEEYGDLPEKNQLKNLWMNAKESSNTEEYESQTTQDSYEEETDLEEFKFSSENNYYHNDQNHDNTFYSQKFTPREYKRDNYKRRGQGHYHNGNNRGGNYYNNTRNSGMDNYYYDQANNMNNHSYYNNNNGSHGNNNQNGNNYYNYNNNYRSCGFGDDYRKPKRNNPKHSDYYQYEFVKME